MLEQIILTLSKINVRKAIMTRTRLCKKFLKGRTDGSRTIYKRQRTICVSLLGKPKRTYFSRLDNKILTDSRTFWKSVNPLFSEKNYKKESILLIMKENIILTTDNWLTHSVLFWWHCWKLQSPQKRKPSWDNL